MERTLFASACLAMMLAACGGGTPAFSTASPSTDSPNQPSTEPDAAAVERSELTRARMALRAASVRRLAGGSPPVETGAEQDLRAQGLVPRADSLISTEQYVDFGDAHLDDFSSYVTCSGTSCTHTEPDGVTFTEDLSSPTFVTGVTLLTRRGVTIESVSEALVYAGRSHNAEYIGSTLDDSAFFSRYSYYAGNEELSDHSERIADVYGDLTGSAPSVSGTWRGLATAVTKQNDDLLLGDAELRYTVSATGGSLEATMGSFVNVTEARETTPLGMVFSDIQVSSDGTFNSRSTRRSFQGAFYGNAHAEAAGVFEGEIPDGTGDLVDLLGAFGTKRVP